MDGNIIIGIVSSFLTLCGLVVTLFSDKIKQCLCKDSVETKHEHNEEFEELKEEMDHMHLELHEMIRQKTQSELKKE